MYDKIAIGKRLKSLRCINGKSQYEVSAALGVSVETIRKLEQGRRGMSVEILDLLRIYYDTKIDYIVYGDK
ncbi:MAG: helix-turn-helix domain-containing protein [Clostridium sp.]|nr:helix-turn-helix domain-containing protein [Clostridium sp.]MCM1459306.1 helix-turn-helix domain-containing protein [Bacteroides sp.]